MSAPVPSLELVERAARGNIAATGRLLSRAEAGEDEVQAALAACYRRAGRAHVVGITGVPGSGKSSLVAKLVSAWRGQNKRVAVVAIDPSSPYSGGSILGDRVRMQMHSLDPDVFIRSMATRGATGGLASATLAAADILDVAGFDMIIIETVGVGQDEVEIARASHTTVVVSAPGLGDDIQAIKAGILEIADIHVVSKCDRSDANRTITDLNSMLALAATLNAAPLWPVPVIGTSAATGHGVTELAASIVKHRTACADTVAGVARARAIAEYRTLKTAEELLRKRFATARGARLEPLIAELTRRTLDPYGCAAELLNHAALGA